MSHTILLVQPGVRPETRTYSDYESVNECMEGVCKIYEEHLKRRNPNTPTITYDISQLFDFLDQVSLFGYGFTFKIYRTRFICHRNDNKTTMQFICVLCVCQTINKKRFFSHVNTTTYGTKFIIGFFAFVDSIDSSPI